MHEIIHLIFPTKTSKSKIVKEANKIAIQNSDYHTGLDGGIRFDDTVLPNHTEAEEWIEKHDKGFYDNLAIRYKEGRSIYWLVKIEYHT